MERGSSGKITLILFDPCRPVVKQHLCLKTDGLHCLLLSHAVKERNKAKMLPNPPVLIFDQNQPIHSASQPLKKKRLVILKGSCFLLSKFRRFYADTGARYGQLRTKALLQLDHCDLQFSLKRQRKHVQDSTRAGQQIKGLQGNIH